ncbi:M24 family metallopeptidase [Microbulbifer pacificus]|uniref:M24 family metallopeptidase n=1 Tax=Microbulbifer pacificus TaxID=407164 RepID=UPI001319CE94|nr:Xaa-Pro peptidase family protein [Microbulbifer pacificus]
MKRIQTLRNAMTTAGIDGLLVASMSNIRYLSGFASDEWDVALLFVSHTCQLLLTDYRFAEQAREECRNTEVIVRDRTRQTLGQLVRQLAIDCDLSNLGFERDHFLHGRWLDLSSELAGVQCTPVHGMVEQLRRIKDEGELANIRRAASIGDNAFEQLLGYIRPGITEKAAAAQLEYTLKSAGAESLAFPTIFTSGPRTARPHGMPSDRLLTRGDLITVDFGAVVDGYRSDMTRSFVLGTADRKQREVYHLVKGAQALGVASVRAGIPCSAPYQMVAEYLSRSPYAAYVGEGLGHCLGLDTHEQPYLAAGGMDLLQENYVLTVEPGIYIPGWGGVRIEDDVRVTETGADLLTHSNRELIEL